MDRLTVIAVIALLAGCTGADPDLRPRMERALSDALGAPVSMARVEVDYLGGVLTAQDVTVGDGRGGRLVHADRLVVRGALELDGVDPREVELVGAVVEMRIVDGSVTGLPAPPGDDSGAVRKLRLTDARVIVRDGPLRVDLSAAEVAVTRDAAGRLTAALSGGAAVVHHGGRSHALHRVAGRGAWAAGRLHVERGAVAGPGFELSVTDGVAALPLGSTLEGEVEGHVDLAQLSGLLASHPDLTAAAPLAGVVKLRGHPRWRDGDASGQVELSGEHLEIAGMKLGPRTRLTVRAERNALHVRGSLTGSDDGAAPLASLEASVTLQHGAPVTAQLSFDHALLTALADHFGLELPPLEAELGGNVTLGGALHPLNVSGPAEVALRRVRAISANSTDSAISAGAPSVSDITLRAHVAATADDVHVEDIQIEAAPGARIGAMAVASAGARVVFDDDGERIRLEALHIEGPDLSLRSDAVVLDRRTGALQSPALLQVDRIDLSRLTAMLPASVDLAALHIEGVAKGSATVTGSAINPDSVELSLALAEPRLLDVQFDSGKLELSHSAAGETAISALTLERSRGRVRITGKLGTATADVGLQVELDALPLEGVLGLSAGRLSGSGRLLQADRSRDGLRLSAVGLVSEGAKLGEARLTARYVPTGHTAATDTGCPRAAGAWGTNTQTGGWLLCGGGLGGRLTIDVAVGDDPDRTLRGTVALRDLPLSPWLPAPFDGTDGTDGSAVVSVQAEVNSGGLSAPETLGGELRFDRVSLSYAGIELEAEHPFLAPMEGGRVQLKDAVLVSNGVRLPLHGHASTGGALALGAKGSIRADRLLGFSSWARRAMGQVATALDVSGTITDPTFAAKLSPQDATVQLAPGATWVHEVAGDVSVEGGELRVEQLGGKVAGGSVRLEGDGRVAAGRLRGYDLTLTARDLEVTPQEGFEVAFGANVTIHSNGGERAQWTGELRVGRLLYARRIPLHAALRALGAGGPRTASKRADGPRVEFDLHLIDGGSLRIRNDILDAELAVPEGLRLVGTDQNLGLIGQLQLEGGRVMFRGDEFQVTHGTLTFDSESHMVPQLDVSGRADARKRTAAGIVFEAKSDGERVGVTVRCEPSPGDSLGVPPPFRCGSVGDKFDCGDLDALVSLWLCQPPLAAVPVNGTNGSAKGDAALAAR